MSSLSEPTVSQWALAIAAIVSALGAWAATFVQSRIAARQIRATVVSSNRQNWIDALRDDVAELLSVLWAFDTHSRAFLAAEYAQQLERFQLEQQANLLLARIRLRLNPDEEPSNQLVGELQSLVRPTPTRDQLLEESVVALTQAILRSEWMRVKAGR